MEKIAFRLDANTEQKSAGKKKRHAWPTFGQKKKEGEKWAVPVSEQGVFIMPPPPPAPDDRPSGRSFHHLFAF